MPFSFDADALDAIGVSGSPAAVSRSRALVERALAALEQRGLRTRLLDLAALPADALLGRRPDPAVNDALDAVRAARIIVVGTPVYRATYSGLLKVFFDLFPADALAGKVAVPIATAASAGHFLAVDHGLRPLLASVGAVTPATGIYGTDAEFQDGEPAPALLELVERALGEATALAAALARGVERTP